MPRIPDRWREYKACNWMPVENQRIISFKTPLSRKFDTCDPSDEGIQEFERFTPSDLINQLAERKMHIGIVLDFTFTTRYYNPKEFTDQGVIYKKMMCPGHVIPNSQDVKRFQEEVKSFLQNDRTGAKVENLTKILPQYKQDLGALVGVHCTHGVNRTGYMVCRYLIDCCGYEPEEAIQAFNKARGHPLERVNYLEDLKISAHNKQWRDERTRVPAHDGRRWNQPVRQARDIGRSTQHHTPRRSRYDAREDHVRDWRTPYRQTERNDYYDERRFHGDYHSNMMNWHSTGHYNCYNTDNRGDYHWSASTSGHAPRTRSYYYDRRDDRGDSTGDYQGRERRNSNTRY